MTTNDLTDLLKGKLTEQIAAYINSENSFPETIINWLAQLVLLHHIPFNNLVADENMFPNESIRLFYLDNNWTNAMLDGALSIGIHSERDRLLQIAMNQIIRQQTNRQLANVKNNLQNQTNEPQTVQLGTISGLMIRSSIVSNYKGLEIAGFVDNTKEEPVKTLRIERLASNILFVLFDTVPGMITLKAPSESRVLAIINNEIPIRQVEGEVGKMTDSVLKTTPSHFRNAEKRVLNITALQQSIAQKIGKSQLSPSEFSIQLMQSPKVFELVNEAIEIVNSRSTLETTILDKNLIFSKLFNI